MKNSFTTDTMALILRLERRKLGQKAKAVFIGSLGWVETSHFDVGFRSSTQPTIDGFVRLILYLDRKPTHASRSGTI